MNRPGFGPFVRDHVDLDIILIESSGAAMFDVGLNSYSFVDRSKSARIHNLWPITDSMDSRRHLQYQAIGKYNLARSQGAINCTLEDFMLNPSIRLVGDEMLGNGSILLFDDSLYSGGTVQCCARDMMVLGADPEKMYFYGVGSVIKFTESKYASDVIDFQGTQAEWIEAYSKKREFRS